MICKVSRGKTLKTDPRRFLVGLGIWCRTLGQLSSSVRHVHERARPDENLPKWSWSPLSRRSSSWSWSRSSVSCDVGVHQSNCRGPCRTFDSSAKGRNFSAEVSCCCCMRSCPACTCDPALCTDNSLAHAHVGFPRGERTQFQKGKKETQPPAKFLIL